MVECRGSTQCGTPPELLGIARDPGSQQAGKIADLVVLHRDPREDIRQRLSCST
jgi:imidazolonepropionase-like amidohydrolase